MRTEGPPVSVAARSAQGTDPLFRPALPKDGSRCSPAAQAGHEQTLVSKSPKRT